MKRAWRGWLRLTSQKESGTSLALFRVAVALVMTTTLGSVMWNGVVDALWIDRAHGGALTLRDNFVLLDWLGGPTPRVVWALALTAAALSVAMALGLGGRWTVAAAALAYRSVSTIGAGSGGYDAMIFNATWLLFLAQPTATLSLDCRLRHGRWTNHTEVSSWPRLLAIGQLVLIYVASGLQKAGVSWTFGDGYSALYWFMQDPTWTRFDAAWAADAYPFLQAFTFLVWHFEVTAPLLLVVLYYRYTAEDPGRLRAWLNARDLRRAWAGFGVAMHLGIAALMDMGPFSWISLAYYVCLWRPEELERVVTRLAGDRLMRPVS